MTEFDPVPPPASEPSGRSGFRPAPARSRGPAFFAGLLSGCALVVVAVVFFTFLVSLARRGETGDVFSTQKVAIIPVEGEIFEARETIEALHRYAQNDTVKAIVMRINSPGGAIAPSQEIYEAVRNTRARSGKPIVASLDSVAASGGFYIAAACDRIVANPGSITGSIGVILEWMNTRDLMAWAKLKPEIITSGALKAAGNPVVDLTDAQRAYFQSIVSELHLQFVRAVATGRKMTVDEVSRLADGRVFTGERALSLKLVDQLGNLDDAVSVAARLAGVRGTPGTIYPRKKKPTLFDLLTDTTDTEAAISRIVNGRPRFLYRW